ncbi:MAG: DUF4836 family protein [Muribaculaceae bacterium]|nr:DUF4836 family protein [Muribaculaceae bacterium]
MICTYCNQEIGNSNEFCPNCGAVLNAQPGQPAQPAGQPAQPAGQQPQYPTQPPSNAQPPKKSHKGLFIGLGVAAALAIIAIACWFFMRRGSDSNLEKMIPSTATAVVRIDAAQLAEKIGLEISGTDIKLPNRVAKLAGENANEINELLGKIKDSGINPLGAMYGFATDEALTAAFLIPLLDQEKTKAFLEKEMNESFSTQDGGYYFTDGDRIFMIKNKALLVGGAMDRDQRKDLRNVASELMDGKRESITSNSDVTSKLHNSKAMSLYVNTQSMLSILKEDRDFRRELRNNPLAFLLEDMSTTSATLAIDDNKVTLATEISTKGNDYEKFMETIFRPAGDDFLKYMPTGCNAVAAAGVNGKKITTMSQISSVLNLLPGVIKSALESINCIAAGATVDPKHLDKFAYTIVIGSDSPNELLGVLRDNLLPPGLNAGVVGNYVYITESQTPAGNFSAPGECKDVFKNNWLAAYASITCASFEFNANLSVNSAKNSSFSFYINENGKPMKPIEWPVAFVEMSEQLEDARGFGGGYYDDIPTEAAEDTVYDDIDSDLEGAPVEDIP